MSEGSSSSVPPVKRIVAGMTGSVSDVDASLLVDRFLHVDSDVCLRTNIKSAESLTFKDAFAKHLKRVGLGLWAEDYQDLLLAYRINRSVEKGWLPEKVFNAIKSMFAIGETGFGDEDESRKSRFLGGGRR